MKCINYDCENMEDCRIKEMAEFCILHKKYCVLHGILVKDGRIVKGPEEVTIPEK